MLTYFLLLLVCSLAGASKEQAGYTNVDELLEIIHQQEVPQGAPTLIGELDEDLWNSVDKICHDTEDIVERLINSGATSELRLVEYTAFSSKHYSLSSADVESLFNSRNFDPNRKTVVFLHGFTDSPMFISGETFALAYKVHGDYNILALNSHKVIKMFYLKSSAMVKYIGEAFGKFLDKLVSKGVHLSNIHLVGHSLGAHIAGFAGKKYQELNPGKKLPRITGMDPAGPCFFRVDSDKRLDKDDADFVDVIHTNAGVYGINKTIGHVDFYPNRGGIRQPGCIDSVCSHNRVWSLYEESVVRPNAFMAVKCSSWDDFEDKKCNKNEKVVMGMNTPSDTRGKYYLRTNFMFPFGMGDLGAKSALWSGIFGRSH